MLWRPVIYEITVLLLRTLRFPEIRTCETTDVLRRVISTGLAYTDSSLYICVLPTANVIVGMIHINHEATYPLCGLNSLAVAFSEYSADYCRYYISIVCSFLVAVSTGAYSSCALLFSAWRIITQSRLMRLIV
jgi:hypothetical protein